MGAAAAPEPSEPSGKLSLFDAMVKQLGLKLEMPKRPLAVVVIDHVERKRRPSASILGNEPTQRSVGKRFAKIVHSNALR
jgi:hypothetical protein